MKPCDRMHCLPGFSHGILHARVLEWVAIFLLQGIFPTQGSNPDLPHSSILSPCGGKNQTRLSAFTSLLHRQLYLSSGFLGDPDGKESSWNAGSPGLIPGLGRSPGEGNGYPLQHSCMENPMDKGAWLATVHRVTKSWTWLSDFHFHGLRRQYANYFST